jgi:hypothetical protein
LAIAVFGFSSATAGEMLAVAGDSMGAVVSVAAWCFCRPTGEWNFQEVMVEGSRIKVELNGNVILDADLAQVTEFMGNRPHSGKDRRRGHFGFAGHSDPVEFRNVRIKQLSGT